MIFKNNIKIILIATFLILGILLESGCSLASNAINHSDKTAINTNNADETKRIIENTGNKNRILLNENINSTQYYGYRNGDNYLDKYISNNTVQQIVLVEQSEAAVSEGNLFLFIKNSDKKWELKLQCKAYLGKNGIDKVQEGDKRTPTGDYGMVMAFGIKEDPGSLIPYTKLTETMYLCSDKEYYNQFIDVSKINHTCSGNSEHLIRYVPQYNYALIFDYNKENIYGKGSAIFLHCSGSYPFTLGCIGVTEDNMVKILQTVDKKARICIYPFK